MPNLWPTPHINASPDDFSETVLMPGDPLRSKFIAENFLSEAILINNVRGIQGYTGKYAGKQITVMASGMGMPSMGIYSYELYNIFGVENIIRIGSAGALSENVKIRDIVFGMATSTNSNFGEQYSFAGSYSPICDYKLLKTAVLIADEIGASYHVGNIISSDNFYCDAPSANSSYTKMGILAVEMEAAALYMTAARAKKRALAICTISDHLLNNEFTTAEEREKSFTEMIEIALKTALKI